MIFGALLADVVRHRKLEDWPQKQRMLLDIAGRISKRFGDSLEFPIEMSGGDRLVVLLNRPEDINRLLLAFEEELFLREADIKLRWGAGLGSLNLMDSPHTTTGEALYRAQSALEYAHRERRSFAFSLGNADTDRLLTLLKNTAHGIRERWTSRQKELRRAFIELRERGSEISQVKLASHLGMSQPAVSKMLKAMLFEEQELLEREIDVRLKSITP